MVAPPWQSPRDPVYVIYRLTATPPVTIETHKGTFVLQVRSPDWPPYSVAELINPRAVAVWTTHFIGKGHAEHTLAHGLKTRQGELIQRVFVHLVMAGHAELVCGPHHELYWPRAADVAESPIMDAFYTWNHPERAPRYSD